MAKEIKKIGKVETVAEYIARGGKITKLQELSRQEKQEMRRQQAGGPAVLLTLEEHDLYHGEKKVSKTAKKKPKVDFNALPEALKKKFLKELKDEEELEDQE